MFTGIIREVGRLAAVRKKADCLGLEIESKNLRPKIGDSVSVNGVCLTVVKKNAHGFFVDVVPETIACTNLGSLLKGAALNLEPSLRAGNTIDGHFVNGHVDATMRVKIAPTQANNNMLTISFPKKLARYIVSKGSVAINGVSLTIARARGTTLEVALIPFTAANTNLGGIKKGAMVNIEVDLIARYLLNKIR